MDIAKIKLKWVLLASCIAICTLALVHDSDDLYAADFGFLLIFLVMIYGLLSLLSRENKSHPEVTSINNALAVCGLVLVCCFTYFFCTNFSSPPLDRGGSDRAGLEQFIYASFAGAISTIKAKQFEILPNRQVNDSVPSSLQTSSGSFKTSIYRVDKNNVLTPVSQRIFSGGLHQIKSMHSDKFVQILTYIFLLIIIAIVLGQFFKFKLVGMASLSLISALSVLTSIRVSEGWDEFFINLRHAYMFNHHGVYSVNAHNMIEATVDFVPVFGTALLGRVGLDLIDAFIIFSLLGNICLIVFAYLISLKVTKNNVWALITAMLVGLYPSVVFVGASGFSATFFSGLILAAAYYVLFADRQLIGFGLLGCLTLVRTEGILFAMLLTIYLCILRPLPKIIREGQWQPALKNCSINGAIVATPFCLSLIVRKMVFGYAIPNPITFKNTGFDSAFFSAGLDSFMKVVSYHDLHLLLIIVILLWIASVLVFRGDSTATSWRINVNKLLILTLITFMFILPYYVGGGDWFPISWNRYGMPFSLMLVLTGMNLLYGVFFFRLSNWLRPAALIVFCASLLFGYQKTAHYREANGIFNLIGQINRPIDNQWQRIDNLASLGELLDKVLPIDAIIASPEEATIMYFSARDMVGLLGVSNPDIAAMPFQPMTPGNIIHRKRAYASIYKAKPDVIALYEPVVLGDFAPDVELAQKIILVMQDSIFNQDIVDIAYYRVGSFKALEKMGYRHISISYPDRIYSLFISNRIYPDLIRNLMNQGFKLLSNGVIYYSVSPELAKKYTPAVDEINITLEGS